MSDESDQEGWVAAEHQVSHDDTEESESEAGSEAEDANEFLEMEASESANEFLDMEASESDGLSDDGDETEPYFFPQFCRLPIELREHIWAFFDPHLKSKGRVFRGQILEPMGLWGGIGLDEQIEPVLAMLATHHESRDLALRHYPDALPLKNGPQFIPFNSDLDVILLSRIMHPLRDLVASSDRLAEILGPTKHLAIDPIHAAHEPAFLQTLLPQFRRGNLQTLYFSAGAEDFNAYSLQYFASPHANRFYLETAEEDAGTGLPLAPFVELFCWPNLRDHGDFAATHVQPIKDKEFENVLTIWPMRHFYGEAQLRRFRRIATVVSEYGKPLLNEEEFKERYAEQHSDWDDSSDPESVTSESEVDEYEIGDFVVDSDDEDEDDEEDQVDSENGNGDTDSESGDDANGETSSIFNGFSPLRHVGEDGLEEEDLGAAQFSDLEPDSPEDHERPPAMGKRSKRPIVSSDDEDDSGEDQNHGLKEPSRPTKRHRIVLSDSEPESDLDGEGNNGLKEPIRSTKRRRIVLSDSESEEEQGDINGVNAPNGSAKASLKEESNKSESDGEPDEDEEEEESGSDDDDDIPPTRGKPLSLLERLRHFREDNPISPSGSNADSDEEAMGDNSPGGFQEDELPDDDEDDEEAEEQP
ncbi:hypothetical protein F4778DRAFT_688270 [Xylariomycetidae sp. FL2044]|nr:hypothetical protein F4778DRAFT_688270 [Xylariomycetidae sp. FL2044]